MSTATTLPAALHSDVTRVDRFVKKVDKVRQIVAAGETPGPRQAPSKQTKAWAYEAAYRINDELGRDRARTVEDLRATVTAAQAAMGSAAGINPTSKTAGTDWAARARAAGFTIRTSQSGVVIELTRSITPGDARAYMAAEAEAQSLLGEVPITTPGTFWGSTSDGVGGHAGLTSGHLYFARSGVSKRFVSGVAG